MKPTIIAIVIGSLLVMSAFALGRGNIDDSSARSASNVSVENGKQVVTISAKGGYSPRMTEAKADMPTTLRVATNGTFDCSSVLAIPAMNYQENLPPSGVTEIELPPQKAGSTFEGLCGMGMYRFEIAFK